MIRPLLAIVVAALVAAPGAVAIDGTQTHALLRLARTEIDYARRN